MFKIRIRLVRVALNKYYRLIGQFVITLNINQSNAWDLRLPPPVHTYTTNAKIWIINIKYDGLKILWNYKRLDLLLIKDGLQ